MMQATEGFSCLVDVFTDQPFGGNQLAVFPDARGLALEPPLYWPIKA
jgi:hypothetical protein